MNRKIICVSIVIFFACIIPLSYVHELGHSYICMMEGYNFDIKLGIDGGRMVCHGEVENDILFDKQYIDLSAPIKTLGEHEINIKFSNDISGSFKLTIEKED